MRRVAESVALSLGDRVDPGARTTRVGPPTAEKRNRAANGRPPHLLPSNDTSDAHHDHQRVCPYRPWRGPPCTAQRGPQSSESSDSSQHIVHACQAPRAAKSPPFPLDPLPHLLIALLFCITPFASTVTSRQSSSHTVRDLPPSRRMFERCC
jgi:hypothetical protein